MSPMPEEPADESGARANPQPEPLPERKPKVVLALPPIALSELQPKTKAYLLRRAGVDRGPWEAMKKLLDRGAGRAGFGSGCSCAPAKPTDQEAEEETQRKGGEVRP